MAWPGQLVKSSVLPPFTLTGSVCLRRWVGGTAVVCVYVCVCVCALSSPGLTVNLSPPKSGSTDLSRSCKYQFKLPGSSSAGSEHLLYLPPFTITRGFPKPLLLWLMIILLLSYQLLMLLLNKPLAIPAELNGQTHYLIHLLICRFWLSWFFFYCSCVSLKFPPSSGKPFRDICCNRAAFCLSFTSWITCILWHGLKIIKPLSGKNVEVAGVPTRVQVL